MKTAMFRVFVRVVPVMLAVVAAAPGADAKIQINGAGATFPYPIYSKWFDEYHKKNGSIEINYQSIGSGGGIRQVSWEGAVRVRTPGVGAPLRRTPPSRGL